MLLNCGVGEDSRVPWTARRSNKSILKEIRPEYSLEGLMLKLKLQYFGYLMWRTDSFEKTLMLGKIEGRRRWGRQRMKWLDGITDSMDMSLCKLRSWWQTVRPSVLWFMGLQSRTRLSDWTELNWTECHFTLAILYVFNISLVLRFDFLWRFTVRCSLNFSCYTVLSCSIVSNSLWPHGL